MSDNPKYDPIAQSLGEENLTPETAIPNPALQTAWDETDAAPISMTLQKIDEIIVNYLTDTISPSIEVEGRVVRVPVMFAAPERWKAVRKDGFMRDKKNDKLQPPLIVMSRVGMSRNKSIANPSNKYMYVTHQAQWNSRNAYDRFAVQNNIRPSLETRTVIVPDYVDLRYQIIVWADKVSQMNNIIEQLNVENDEFWGLRNQYKFRVRIDQYDNETELPPTQERIVRTTFNMAVGGYLVPEQHIKNFAKGATNSKYYTSKKTVILTETDRTGVNADELHEYYERTKWGK